jgi:hypothetical protein
VLFNDYKEVPKIKEIQAEVDAIKAQLQKQVFEEFDKYVPDPSRIDICEIELTELN